MEAARAANQCNDQSAAIPATPTLQQVASNLEEWEGKAVYQHHMGPVLLEYLRTYECAMNERREFLFVTLQREHRSAQPLTWGDLDSTSEKQLEIMQRELLTAREALNRTFVLTGGGGGFSALESELDCVKRASLDLRNVFGLAADASACLPRTWDARTGLFDLKNSNE